eukprot:1142260-Pelagomonas_calceolata.AAC.12
MLSLAPYASGRHGTSHARSRRPANDEGPGFSAGHERGACGGLGRDLLKLIRHCPVAFLVLRAGFAIVNSKMQPH